ncbi:hypothetical protein LCGC14_0278310 [marine sediment metagenome]|uniref:Uncharacterized protein n=1 Tax=marine sediment metagenome TaxID=412755 RepID=A0A0F9X242_9ZZZZ
MANKGLEVDPLDYLEKIVDYCVGNVPADEIGANEFSTLPEALSKLDTTPGDRNAVQIAIQYMEKLKSKVVFLETQLLRLRRLQERGIIR